MNQQFIDQLISKNPALTRVRTKLESMKSGSYCLHKSWGFGIIKSFDETQQKLIIDFDSGSKGHGMDPVFCIDKLEILQESNILVQHKKNPKEIDDLAKKTPEEFIIKILSESPHKSLPPSELEKILVQILGETKFKKWWPPVKKSLSKDPRIAVPVKKADSYVLRDEPMNQEEELLELFYKTTKSLDKLKIAEKIIDSSSSLTILSSELPTVLSELKSLILSSKDFSKADRLTAMWLSNELAQQLNLHDQIFPDSAFAEYLEERNSLNDIIAKISPKFYSNSLSLIKSLHPDRWDQVLLQLVRFSESKFISDALNFLADNNALPLLKDAFIQWMNEQSFKASILMWIVKNRHSKKFYSAIEPLIEPRLLAAILSAVDYEALQQTGNKRIPLADLLSEDANLIADLLENASPETAQDLAQTLILNQGFEPLTKKSLLARFIKSFPSVQSIVTGNTGEPPKEIEQLIVSQVSLDARKKEYEILVTQKIPENKQAIVTAREHGDLRENSEYKMARQDQDTLMARKAQLEAELSRARVTDFQDVSPDTIGIGHVVEIKEASTGKIHKYAILGAWDSNPENNILSYKTPLCQAIIGKKLHDVVSTAINGHKETWTICSISKWSNNFPSK